jgi:plasmid stabilization system protein ParE
MNNFRLLRGAASDLRQAEAWYRARDVETSLRFAADARATIAEVARTPDMWPRIDNRHRFKPLQVFPYYVVYRRYFEEIVIVAVSQNRRRRYWKGR